MEFLHIEYKVIHGLSAVNLFTCGLADHIDQLGDMMLDSEIVVLEVAANECFVPGSQF